MINVLFVPYPMPSHIIPLIALDQLLNKSLFKSSFLLPKNLHLFGKKMGVEVLDIDRELQHRTTSEMMAFAKFKPDVVVDDLNFTTAFSTRFAEKPRIAIVRKGILPLEDHKPGSLHSSPLIGYLEKLKEMDLPSYGIWKPESKSDLFVGDVNIIPSIPSVEALTDGTPNKDAYLYCGPLILSDDEIMKNLQFFHVKNQNYTDNRKQIQDFIDRNKSLRIAYFTHGITEPTSIVSRANNCIRFLLDEGFAVITSTRHTLACTEEETSRLFSSNVLPMQIVCSHADIMIHHCGSATYNYQLLYQVPGIVMGSNFYDRDEIGMQLDKLNAAIFISPDLDEEAFLNKFKEAVTSLKDNGTSKYAEQKSALSSLSVEVNSVQLNFNFNEVIINLLKKKGKNFS